MLYTVVASEDIWEGVEKEPAPTVEMSLAGVIMQLEPLGDFQAKIVRIVSTNPQDYLLASYQPGTIVRWT
ncbi:MAG: hypothetical protein GX335_06855 [Firmicutes bacterium]|nr:hypothetical protein [Bacillota bacterium]